jgi:hypothetical protein
MESPELSGYSLRAYAYSRLSAERNMRRCLSGWQGCQVATQRTVADLLPEPTEAQHFEELRADEERIRQRYAIR